MDVKDAAVLIAAGMAVRDGKTPAEAARLYFECLDALTEELNGIELTRKLDAAVRRRRSSTLDSDEVRNDQDPDRPNQKVEVKTKRGRR